MCARLVTITQPLPRGGVARAHVSWSLGSSFKEKCLIAQLLADIWSRVASECEETPAILQISPVLASNALGA